MSTQYKALSASLEAALVAAKATLAAVQHEMSTASPGVYAVLEKQQADLRETVHTLQHLQAAEAVPEGAVTEDDILNSIGDADMYDANAVAVAQSVYAMLKSKGVVK